MVFFRFSLAYFSIYWVIAEWETQVCLSCKITPDASADSESGEEGGKNPKSVDQLLQLILKNTAEPIYMKIGSSIAYTLGFHLGV